MINFSDINIISQKTDIIGQTSDFDDLLNKISKENLSIDVLREYPPKSKAQTFWWIDGADKWMDGADNKYYNQIKQLSLPMETMSETTSFPKIFPLNNEDFKAKHRESFLCLIKSIRFISGEDNQATELLSKLLTENKDATLSLLGEYFIKTMSDEKEDESLLVKILSMLSDYDYEELFPVSQTIVLCAFKVKSIKVKSASFNLFGHWGNNEALNLLRKYDEPEEPWLKMKYNVLLHSLEERCSTHVK
ncbi:hypothetical protein [Bacteroides ihuae]|uniref:hypothetical protein n=1 Tax=Bacteroides ihuae TaxID=1852362 RepID=UPI0008D9DAF9|nr:hypothetical protein [Bacteroides ihuae]